MVSEGFGNGLWVPVGGLREERRAYCDICGAPECSGKGTSSRRMLAKVWLRLLPLKGVVPKSIS